MQHEIRRQCANTTRECRTSDAVAPTLIPDPLPAPPGRTGATDQDRFRPNEDLNGSDGYAARWLRAFGTDAGEAPDCLGFVYRRLHRRLATGRRDTFSGFRPSHKTGRMVAYESLLERGAAIVLEGAWEVTDYLEQPARESWDDEGKARTYTADFGVLTTFGIVYVEVKPRCFALAPATKAKHRAIRAALAVRGIGHVVWTEGTIARPSRAIALLLCAARRANSGSPT